MKLIPFIGLFFFFSGLLSAQVPDLPPEVSRDSTGGKTDSLNFKPQYRRGIKYHIKTTAGTEYMGFVVNETYDFIIFEDRNTHEIAELKKSTIVVAKVLSDRQSYLADIAGENIYASDYMFSASAFLFKKEHVSFNVHWLLLSNMDYAFSENVAVTVSSLLVYPVSVGLKCAFRLDQMNYVGASVFLTGDILPTGDNPVWGYGTQVKFTHGTSNQNFTLAGGIFGLNSNFFYNPPPVSFINLPFASLAYCNRLGIKTALNLECWYLPEFRTAFAGAGIKLVHNKEHCWTFGCYGILNNFSAVRISLKPRAVPIPYISLLQKF